MHELKGLVRVQAAARTVLSDWISGRIAYYTMPPALPAQADSSAAALVSEWAPEFDAEATYGQECRAVLPELQPLEGPGAGNRRAWVEAESGTGSVLIADADDDDAQPGDCCL